MLRSKQYELKRRPVEPTTSSLMALFCMRRSQFLIAFDHLSSQSGALSSPMTTRFFDQNWYFYTPV